MLKEEQVAALLTRCEVNIGQCLDQVRGNLSRAENRSAAIWELLVLDASMELGSVEYEPHPGGSPDIRMILPTGEKIWIEIAFLYPRFWKEERQSFEVSQWLREEANRRGIDGHKISCRFDGLRSRSGFVRKLPLQHERKSFLKSTIISGFFNKIAANKAESVTFTHSDYTLSVTYSPQSNFGSGGGLVQEAPTHYKDHALYRITKEKARQHDVPGVRLLCIGSDQSRALSDFVAPDCVNPSTALRHAFNETSSVTGVITVSIENRIQAFGRIARDASAKLYLNEKARVGLSELAKRAISKLNFNRWKYHHPLNKYDSPRDGLYRKLGGSLTVSTSNNSQLLKIPTSVLIEVLAGRTSLEQQYGMDTSHLLSGAYRIISSSFEAGSPEKGEASSVTLEFARDFDAVFERSKQS